MDEEIKMNAEEEYTEYEQQAEEKLDSFYEENKAEAEAILNDVDKMEEMMQKLEKKLKTVPISLSSSIFSIELSTFNPILLQVNVKCS